MFRHHGVLKRSWVPHLHAQPLVSVDLGPERGVVRSWTECVALAQEFMRCHEQEVDAAARRRGGGVVGGIDLRQSMPCGVLAVQDRKPEQERRTERHWYFERSTAKPEFTFPSVDGSWNLEVEDHDGTVNGREPDVPSVNHNKVRLKDGVADMLDMGDDFLQNGFQFVTGAPELLKVIDDGDQAPGNPLGGDGGGGGGIHLLLSMDR